MRRQTILITGAAGRVGRLLRRGLARPGRELRLLDPAGLTPEAGEATFTGSVTDSELTRRAAAGCDAIVHLGGLPGEAPWPALAEVNVEGTRTVLEAAREAGVPRVVLASSAHVAGFYRRPGSVPRPRGVPGPEPLPADAPPRPDTLYGVSKAAVEALGSLYAERFGLAVFALRLGDVGPEPPGEWALHSWLSPGDCARLIEACLSTGASGYHVVWGISRNARRWWSLTEGERIGYHPGDDAEEFAGKVAAAHGDRASTLGLAGGRSTVAPLGERRR